MQMYRLYEKVVNNMNNIISFIIWYKCAILEKGQFLLCHCNFL